LGDFDAYKPTFLKTQPWSLAWSYGPGTPSAMPNFVKKKSLKKSLREPAGIALPLRWCILISS